MTKRFRTLIAGFAGVVLVATACTPTGGPSANESPAASDKPQQGGKIIEGDTSDIATMQPVLVNDTRSRRIVQLIYDVSVRVANLDHVPARDNKGPRAGKATTSASQ